MKLTIDIETFSRVNLKTAGLYRYAEDESTDLLCVCWALDDGPVSAWVPSADWEFELPATDETVLIGGTAPIALFAAIANGAVVHAWNANFERQVLNGPAGQRYGFPKLKIEQMRCSMARARYNSMPGALEDCANVLNAPVKKRVIGVNAMRYLCKPRADGTRPTIVEERERFLQLVPYCADDVRAERAVDSLLPEMSPKEQRVWELDQAINDRGVKVDLESVDNMEVLVGGYKEELKAKCLEITGIAPSRPGPLSEWVRAQGFPLQNLQADTVRKALFAPDLPKDCATVLKIYSTYNMKAVAKYPAIRGAVCKDGRVRGMLQYHAASTGRWSSYIIQIHNLFRPVIDDPETAIEAAQTRDLDWLRALYDGVDPMKVVASCVRGMLVADEDKELVFPDFRGIEARWVAWIFGEQWKVDAFARGDNIYAATYARSFGTSTEGLSKKKLLIGKVLELSMQYQGGVGAFIKMAATYKIDLLDLADAWGAIPGPAQVDADESYEYAVQQGRGHGLPREIWRVCEALKLLWRYAHPKIVRGWKNLEDAAKNAVANPGEIYSVANKRLMFKVEGDFLIMRLPSGRKTRYYQPRIEGDKLVYQGVDTVTRQWGKTSTYGGKLCENQAQGGCRDLLVDNGLIAFEERNWPVVMHVHDEPVMEVPIGSLPADEVERIMCRVPEWAEGFPLAIEGHRGARYRK